MNWVDDKLPHAIVSVTLTENGQLEVVRKYPSNERYGPGQPSPDKVQKEIYICVDGKIILHKIIEGKHTPAYRVPEKIEF